MSQSRYDELVSLYFDGEPQEQDLDELAGILKADRLLAEDFHEQLQLWDLYSQETSPERSEAAFSSSFKTRLRAENDAPKFELAVTNKLKARKLPMPFHPMIAVAGTAILMLLFSSLLVKTARERAESTVVADAPDTHICVHGECVCTKCTLHLTEDHQRAFRYKAEGGKEQIVFLENNPEMNMRMKLFCQGPTPALVEGDLEDSADGRMVLTAVAFKAFPANQVRIPRDGPLLSRL